MGDVVAGGDVAVTFDSPDDPDFDLEALRRVRLQEAFPLRPKPSRMDQVKGARANGYDVFTQGEWETESEACAALDTLIQSTGLFQIFREVRGHYMAPRLDTKDRAPRLDRVLFPSPQLIERGWTLGPVGVECKRSGEKLGRPIAQMLDYGRAIWNMGDGMWVGLRFMFLWPLDKQHGDIASVMTQNRLGGISTDGKFHNGEIVLAQIRHGEIEVRDYAQQLKHGNGTGHR
jgi:hypothetical protein